MTTRELAENFLARFIGVRESDIVALDALLVMQGERRMAMDEFGNEEPTVRAEPFFAGGM